MMLDIKFVRENPEKVKENIKKKFQDEKLSLVDEVIELYEQQRKVKLEGDNLRSERNNISNSIGALMREKKIDEANNMKEKVKEINDKLVELETKEIPYSAAVLKNDTVVVTVSNRNKKSYMEASSSIKDKLAEKCFESDKAVSQKQNQRAFFSRDKLKKEAQRIKNKDRQNTPTKDKHQGLE